MKRAKSIFILALCFLLGFSASAKALVYDPSGNAPDGTSWQTWGDRAVIDTFSDSPYGKNSYDGIFKQNCFMFVRLVLKLENNAGYNRGSITSYQWNSEVHGSALSTYSGAEIVSQHHVGKDGRLTGAIVEEKFSQAHTADLVQMRWNSSQHTALINGFEERNGQRGVHFFQANPNIRDNFYTFEELASKYNTPGYYGGFTIYCFGHGPGGDAPEWGSNEPDPTINPGLTSLTTSSYAHIYTLENKKYYDVYSNSSLTSRISSTAWTGEDDDIHLTGVGRNSSGTIYAQISYPISSERRTAYVNLKNILVPDGEIVDGEPKTAVKNHSGLYKRRNSEYTSSYSVKKGDKVYLLSKVSDWCQILYPEGNYWRIAWLSESDYKILVGIKTQTIEITYPNENAPCAGKNYSLQFSASPSASSWGTSNGTRPSNADSDMIIKTTTPPGLSISSSGLLSGMPQHTSEGQSAFYPIQYNFNVFASNSSSQSGNKEMKLSVWEPPVITTNSTLADGTVNSPYRQEIKADGTEWSMEWEKLIGTFPPGLTLSSENSSRTAVISGKPTRAGTYTFTLLCENCVGLNFTTKRFTIKIKGDDEPYNDTKMSIWYNLFDQKEGSYFSDWVYVYGSDNTTIDRIKSSSSYAQLVSGSIPQGTSLYWDRSTRRIYLRGTPTESGTFTFTVRVIGSHNGYTQKTLTIYIEPKRGNIFRDSSMTTTWDYLKGKLGVYYNDYIRVNGGSSPYDVSVINGSLPNGLNIDVSGRYIYLCGTPNVDGTYNFTLRIIGNHNGYVDKACKLVISSNNAYLRAGADDTDEGKPKIITSKFPNIETRTQWTADFEATGAKPITWTISDGELPVGFSLTSDGTLSGLTIEPGKYKFKVTAENSEGTATKSYTLKVIGAKPVITTESLPDGLIGEPYDIILEADGTAPIKFSKSGKFPKGLKLNGKTGEITGTPKAAGTYDFTIKAKNKAGKTSMQFQIVINADDVNKDLVTQDNAFTAKFVPIDDNSEGLNDLYIISDDEETFGNVEVPEGEPLTFGLDEWTDEDGEEIEASNVKIFVNDKELEGVKISDDGTFTLPAELVNGEFSVYVSAKAGDVELRTSEIKISAQSQNENDSGECNITLSGMALMLLCSALIFKKR